MAGRVRYGIFWGFLPIGGGLNTLHHAQGGAINGERGGAIPRNRRAQSAEQRNADTQSHERRSTDAPPRRHRPPPGLGMGVQVGVGARPGRWMYKGAPVYV